MTHTEVAAWSQSTSENPQGYSWWMARTIPRYGIICTDPHNANQTRCATRGTRAKACPFRFAGDLLKSELDKEELLGVIVKVN